MRYKRASAQNKVAGSLFGVIAEINVL